MRTEATVGPSDLSVLCASRSRKGPRQRRWGQLSPLCLTAVVPGQIDSDVSASSNSATSAGRDETPQIGEGVTSANLFAFASCAGLDRDKDEIWKRSKRPEPLLGGGMIDHNDSGFE
jgi:hypothetical protein